MHLSVLKFDSSEDYLSYQKSFALLKTVIGPFWNNVTSFPVSVDLMEASGVLETNKCQGLREKEGDILFSHCLLLARFYIYL